MCVATESMTYKFLILFIYSCWSITNFVVVTLKVPFKIVADGHVKIYIYIYFSEKIRRHFLWIVCLANNACKMSSLIFLKYMFSTAVVIAALTITSSDDKHDIFLFFPENSFDVSCKLSPKEGLLAWNVKAYLLGKIRKMLHNIVYWNFYPAC